MEFLDMDIFEMWTFLRFGQCGHSGIYSDNRDKITRSYCVMYLYCGQA